MNRNDMYMAEGSKLEEIKRRLNPIVKWHNVNRHDRIFHDSDNNIFNKSYFGSYSRESNVVNYSTKDDRGNYVAYELSGTGWYYYDESIADEVNEHYTPKLYIVTDVACKEDYFFMVAFDEEHLKKVFLEELGLGKMSDEDFGEKYNYEVMKEVNGFEITLR